MKLNKKHPLYQEDLQNILSLEGLKNIQGKTFLITGATGMVGVMLIDALMALGNVKVIAVNGLNGTKKIFAARAKDIYAGVDMEGDEEQFDLWYSKDHQEYRLAIKFNIGATYAFGDQVVLGKTA